MPKSEKEVWFFIVFMFVSFIGLTIMGMTIGHDIAIIKATKVGLHEACSTSKLTFLNCENIPRNILWND